MGDVKCLKYSVCNASNVCGRASVEEEIAIPGHYGILKVDGGWINRVVFKVREQNVDACGARCQGRTNIFGGSEIFEGLNDASKTWRMAAKGVIIDDARVVEVNSRP
jgi:hypothetical protein